MLGLLFALVGISAACVLIYNTAIYALPVAVGLWVGFAALHSGSGAIVAFAVGFVAGAVVFGIGQSVWNSPQPKVLRYAVAFLFVVPAVWTGYCATQQISTLIVPSPAWRSALALVGAIAVGLTAFVRLAAGASALMGQQENAFPIGARD